MKNNISIIGIGDLVADYYFYNDNFIGCSGGGSVWNILATMSKNGHVCYAIGSCGNDDAGIMSINELQTCNVNTTAIILKKNTPTKRMFVCIPENYEVEKEVKANYICPFCGKNYWHSKSFLNQCKVPELIGFNDSMSLVIFDNLKRENFDFINNLIVKNKLIVFSLGHKYNLRYLSRDKILSNLMMVDILQINDNVLSYLLKLLAYDSVKHFFDDIGLNVLIVTNAKEGTTFYYKIFDKTESCLFVPERIVKEQDSSGAGDTFLSIFLHRYIDIFMLKKHLNTDILYDIFKECQCEVEKTLTEFGARANIYKIKVLDTDFCECQKKLVKESNNINNSKSLFKGIYKNSKLSFNYTNLLKKIEELDGNDNYALYNKVFNEKDKKLIVSIGAGGSFIPAQFFSEHINKYIPGYISVALKPRDAFFFNHTKIDIGIFFSYSGTSPDIVQLIDDYKKYAVKIVLITFQDEKKIREKIHLDPCDTVISYRISSDARERGFLTFMGVIAPIIQFSQFVDKSILKGNINYIKWFNYRLNYWEEYLDSALNQLLVDTKKGIDIFSGDFCNTFALLLESMLTESGFARVQIHEKKDFSHGRFVLLNHFPPSLIIFPYSDPISKYEKMLVKYLKQDNDNVLELPVCNNDNASFDLLIAAYALINSLGKINNCDLSNPFYDETALKLYKYSSDFY